MPTKSVRWPPLLDADPEKLAVSSSEAMRSVIAKIRKVAPTRATVLLSGETGVGKGFIARLIHIWSNRRDKPFLAVHCGAIPETLLESELFGHEKGAFTGAHRQKQGKFELADGGTLFLDEVGTISPAAQVKLLDVLQERCFQRVGGEENIDVDIRIVAASNSDLASLLRAGSFRIDLYHRLNVFPIEIPPLRERKEDLPHLVGQLVERLNRLYAREIVGLHPEVEEAFQAYAWPGNVRELENVVERAHILETSSRISPAAVPLEILRTSEPLASCPATGSRTLSEVRSAAVALVERRYLIEILDTWHGRIDASARAAGISTRQLRKLLARHKINRRDFRPARAPGPVTRARPSPSPRTRVAGSTPA